VNKLNQGKEELSNANNPEYQLERIVKITG
jgi:hypothetical protein